VTGRDHDATAGRRLGLGIVGCGGASLAVARAATQVPGLSLVAAMDRNIALAADLVAPTAGRVHASLDALLADPAVDIAYVAVPHDLLSDTALRVLAAGHHVIIEKPMALTLDAIDRIEREAQARGRLVGVMFQLRKTSAVVAARALIRDGALGPIRAVRITTVMDKPESYWSHGLTGRNRDSWRASRSRAGGGILLMNSIHQIDILDFLLDLYVVRATAETAAGIPDVEVEDVAAGTLLLRGGAIVSIAASAHAPGADGEERIEIDGTLGAIRIRDLYREPNVFDVYLRRPFGAIPSGEWVALNQVPADPFVETLQGFVAGVVDGSGAPVGTAAASKALAIVLQLYRAASAGRAEEELPRSLDRRDLARVATSEPELGS
jgi:UDP-N-acetyl-2-amino-2-deoxyglucuronate dehydrogenase